MSSMNSDKKPVWRSLDQLFGSEDSKRWEQREFQEGASEMEAGVSRRLFLKLMGASAALAGVAGCGLRRPVQTIRPYANTPEHLVPGKGNYYATTHVLGEDVVGVLAHSFEGRPTKLEGNPLHPESQGKTNSLVQASVLNLYDPDRLQAPLHGDHLQDKAACEKALEDIRIKYKKNAGRGLAVLAEGSASPSYHDAYVRFKRAFPKADFYRYDAINRDTVKEGLKLATGRDVVPVYNLEKADVIVSFDSDFLGKEVGSTAYAKAFADRRDPDSAEKMNRLYVFENHYTLTGGKADHRYPVKSSDIEGVLWMVAAGLLKEVNGALLRGADRDLIFKVAHSYESVVPSVVIKAVIDDLLKHKRNSLLVAGPKQPATVHGLIYLLNHVLGNDLRTVSYYADPFARYSVNRKSSLASVSELAERLDAGRVQTLIVLGGNPAYDAPSNLNIGPKIAKVDQVVHLTLRPNETTQVSEYALPQAHYLESWGDAVSQTGVASIVQPLISPMMFSYTPAGLLNRLAGSKQSDYAYVRRHWRLKKGAAGFDAKWKSWLHDGLISDAGSPVSIKPVNFGFVSRIREAVANKAHFHEGMELVFHQDYSVYDGRFVNNGWMQELPDPITKLTWDNAALVSPKTAKKLGLPALNGLDTVATVFKNPLPIVSIKVGNKNLETVILPMPGHADDSISLFLGYGQKHAGRVGDGTGFNAEYLRTSDEPWIVKRASIFSTDKRYELASTQEHGSLEGRPILAKGSLHDYEEHPKFAQEMEESPPLKSLWQEHDYSQGQQWGMAIDLSRCTGCNACVVGCQSENNIPIVGKEEVMNGREMHWIRMDRYFEGEKGDANPKMDVQPMTCIQCENAPCEQVCPVAATTHSKDGLNQMTYNRCIGTRYCANNCPVKVRRFNFFDYHQRNPQAVKKDRQHFFDYFKEPDKSIQKQFNPDVTVRMRGVMEKCTFCVQRINQVKSRAKLENRTSRDLEIQTACMQVCPSDAIVFGDINDPKSKVSKLKARNRNYSILRGLHLKARLSFLAVITNPHPWIEAEEAKHRPAKKGHHGKEDHHGDDHHDKDHQKEGYVTHG